MFQFYLLQKQGLPKTCRRIIFCCLSFAFFVTIQPVLAKDNVMTLATTNSSNARMKVVDGKVPEDNPGWFIELSRRAASQCKGAIKIELMPWKRALEMVKRGDVAAAFSSSFKTERAIYGVYPMKGDVPDEDRAAKRIVYRAYISSRSKDSMLVENSDISGRNIVVERGASIIPALQKKGAVIFESGDDLSMMRMVAGNRVDAAVGIEDNIDEVLLKHEGIQSKIAKTATPIKKSIGYVMFSKKFYEPHKELVECFWTTSGILRQTAWFKEMRASYQ